jgi:hypothetical protein
MTFSREPAAYHKTALSDLQGAWQNLRASVVERLPFPQWERLLFHIDEGMSWENVRDLKNMRKTLLIIRNIVVQASPPGGGRRICEHGEGLSRRSF